MFKKILLIILLFIIGVVGSISAMYYYRDRLPVDIFHMAASRDARPVLVNVPIAEASDNFSSIANAVSPSVVNISTVKMEQPGATRRHDPLYDFFSDFFTAPGEGEQEAGRSESDLGSGLLVSQDGYILTSSHLVLGAHKITVTLYDRRVFGARLVGADPKTDLAVLKIDASGLTTIPWGDSDTLRPGQFVLAIGNPFGLSHTVTMGIISAVGRANVGIAEFEDFIQTDAAINPGNSGGPLVNRMGRLVGINTAIFTKSGGYQGIGFAVPGNMARQIMDKLILKGRVVRGWLGVSLQEMTPGLAGKFGHEAAGGALVSDTLPGSPARKAGIVSGDIILIYDGRKVAGHSDLKRMVAMSQPQKMVTLKVFRDGRTRSMSMAVGVMPEPGPALTAPKREEDGDVFAGISVIALSEDISSQLNLEADVTGVVVAGVEPGSVAAEEGIRRGDLIEEINRQPVSSVSGFRKMANSLAPGETVLVLVNRGGKRFFLTISNS
jgi:serine protease Do